MNLVDQDGMHGDVAADLSPLAILKKERDMMEHGRNELDQSIASAMVQRHTLNCLLTAIEHELDRLRSLGDQEPTQLEFPFDD